MNLEYFFSRTGLAKAAAGDLETGLPPQIAKRHQPLRLLCVVEQLPEIVLKVIKQLSTAYAWFANEWVHLVVIDPVSRELRVLKNGKMVAFKSDRRLAEVEVH